MDDIKSKDENLNQEIYTILNDAYHEFINTYGLKHGERIKELIEGITDKVKQSPVGYLGAIATANALDGIRYTKSDKLSAVLKHELWHVYNKSATDKKSLFYLPENYKSKLEENGYIQETYSDLINDYISRFKDDPEILNSLMIDYESYKQDRFDLDAGHVEMWTEWFNSQTHKKDMKDNFWDWKNGFFTYSNSSKSFYDSYINIAGIISCLIPKEKLLEMYLNMDEYKTDYSYPQMQDEFDKKYTDSLDEKEKDIYKYPYLKILMNIKTIDDNARNNPPKAMEALQSCLKTCFNAYLIKLESIKEFGIEDAKEIFNEIKELQKNMLWNVDISKMEDLDYIQSMREIQNKFRELVATLDIENPEVKKMLENIDYTASNPFKMIEDGKKILQRMFESEDEKKNEIINVSNFHVKVGKNGLKNNLYSSLFILLGDKKFNYLYEGFSKNSNILLDISKQIEEASTEDEIVNVYNNIYELYAKKIEDTLKTDQNIERDFDKCSKEIVELQKKGLFDIEKGKYSKGLERIIELYNEKANEYVARIDKITQQDIQENLDEGRDLETAKRFAEFTPNKYKAELNEQIERITKQREKQLKGKRFSEQNIGKQTIDSPTSKKQEADKTKKENMIEIDKTNEVNIND